MAGLLGTLNTAKSGMNVSQLAIQTTSHNISNINTEGYSRQKVQQTASTSCGQAGKNSGSGVGKIGTGAQINDVTRIRNSFYDYQYRSESHEYGNTSIKYDYFNNVESIFNEPSDSAISSSLNDFFNGWNELSKDPDSESTKSVVIENAEYVANNINDVFDKLESLEESLNSQQDYILDEVNSMLSQIKDLDKNIKIVEGSGKSPNDMLDQRDKLLDDLSFKLNISDSDVQNVLKESYDNKGKVTLEDLKNSGVTISGEIEGTIEMQEQLKSYKESLTTLANTITSSVNKVAGQEIFKTKEGEIISVNSEITNNLDNINIKGETALQIYDLKTQKININGKQTTINGFYNNIVQEFGEESASVIRDESNQSKLLSDIDSSRSSVSGVSLDEEMINLVELQYAYTANAKVMTTVDSLLDVVVNGLVK